MRGPGTYFLGAIALFALLGLLVSSTGSSEPETPAPSPPPTRQPRPAGPGPDRLARTWGESFATWSHRTLADQLERLADTAMPRLAAELRRGAQAVRRDRGLARDKAASSGRVVAIKSRGNGARRALVVVTRELPTTSAGADLHGRRYRVYEGTAVQDAAGRWRMDEWERQP